MDAIMSSLSRSIISLLQDSSAMASPSLSPAVFASSKMTIPLRISKNKNIMPSLCINSLVHINSTLSRSISLSSQPPNVSLSQFQFQFQFQSRLQQSRSFHLNTSSYPYTTTASATFLSASMNHSTSISPFVKPSLSSVCSSISIYQISSRRYMQRPNRLSIPVTDDPAEMQAAIQKRRDELRVRLMENTQERRMKSIVKRFRIVPIFFLLFFSGSMFYLTLLDEKSPSWQLAVLKSLPLRFLSRAWGWMHAIELPTPLRAPLYKLWTYLFDCNLSEMAESDLKSFPNLSAFFIRHLREGVRPISEVEMVSPVDARVTVFGKVEGDCELEQIKGMKYKMEDFLGYNPYRQSRQYHGDGDDVSVKSCDPNRKPLYYIVFYLAPGDYHRIHNSTTSLFHTRRHFPGTLFPVAPSIAYYVPSLFTRNERVVLSGEWMHGFYSLTAVGAYNVGSVKLNYDDDLVTNSRGQRAASRNQLKKATAGGVTGVGTAGQIGGDAQYVKVYGKKAELKAVDEEGKKKETATGETVAKIVVKKENVAEEEEGGLRVGKGVEIARFQLGSTVVLVFEGGDVTKGEEMKWHVTEGQKIKMGEPVAEVIKRKK